MNYWEEIAQIKGIPTIHPEYRIDIGFDQSPCDQYEISTDRDPISGYLKREDTNPSGSHKDRSLLLQIASYIQKGIKAFALSSSGNSAISAAHICMKTQVHVHIFLPPTMLSSKTERLASEIGTVLDAGIRDFEKHGIAIHVTKRPVSSAFNYAKENGLTLLRSSTDPLATIGYQTIAYELSKQCPQATDLVFPVSSGSSAVGTYEGYRKLLGSNTGGPRIHIVQTEFVHTMAKAFDNNFTKINSSIASAIVDRVGHRTQEVLDIIDASRGYGWVVSETEIQKALCELHSKGIHCSAEGAMTIAAVRKAVGKGWILPVPVCMITGVQ